MIRFKTRHEAYLFIVEMHEEANYTVLVHPAFQDIIDVFPDGNYLGFLTKNQERQKYSFGSQRVADLVNAYQYLLMDI